MDIVVSSETFQEHIRLLDLGLHALDEEGLTLKFKKCQFAQTIFDFFGHIVHRGTPVPNKSNIKTILDYPVAKKVRDIQCFLGAINLYREYVPHLSTMLSTNQASKKRTKGGIGWTLAAMLPHR